MANTGKSSEDLFEEHIKARGGFAYRLEDLFDASKKKMVKGRQASDFIVTVDQATHYGEVKSIETKQVFSFSSIQPEQWRVATHVNRVGGAYVFYLHFMDVNVWCAVPAHVILRHDKKSIRLRDVEQYRFELAA